MRKKSGKDRKAPKNKFFPHMIIIIAAILVLAISYNKPTHSDFVCKDCNVILISIDTLRADHLSTYGYYRNTSPKIDRFGSKSILFENAISQETWTIPSHISIFTSLYPLTHRVGINNTLAENATTLTEVLKSEGYATAAFTAWGWAIAPTTGLGRGFDIYRQINYTNASLEKLKESSVHYLDNSNPVFGWLEKNRGKKFFLFFHTASVHDPYVAAKNYSKVFDPSYSGAMLDSEERLLDIVWDNPTRFFNKSDTVSPEVVARQLVKSTMNISDARDVYHLVAVYDGKILQTDGFVGFFLERAEGMGLLNNTIIVLLSDHGEELFDHGKLGHSQQLYDETIHVPLIIYNPRVEGGARIKEQAQLIDVMPTVLDMLGMNIPKVEGRSLLPLVDGTAGDSFNSYVFSTKGLEDASVREISWKAIFKSNGVPELYNLISDPRETKNIIKERNDKFSELKEKLFEWGKSIGIKSGDTEKSIEEELRKLGYIT